MATSIKSVEIEGVDGEERLSESETRNWVTRKGRIEPVIKVPNIMYLRRRISEGC